MKQLEILNGCCLVVELPEHADRTVAYGLQSNPPYINWMGDDGNLVEINLPPGNWRIIGMLSEVREEQADALVKRYTWSDGFSIYHNYNGKNTFGSFTALESLESAIRAEGYTFQSTLKPENKDFYWGYLDDLAKWETAQSRVLDRSRCLLLGREGE